MAERHTVLEPAETSTINPIDAAAEALREANLRAERAEQELRRLKGQGAAKDTSSEAAEPAAPAMQQSSEAESALRQDSMMAHLLDSLHAGKDIGHYGRLVFAMVARHFMPHEEVVNWLTRDRDFSPEQANVMMRQVEGRDYNPPRRDRILEWQREQEFPILPNPEDPDCGNLYRNLKFPDSIYHHIEHYQEQKASADEAQLNPSKISPAPSARYSGLQGDFDGPPHSFAPAEARRLQDRSLDRARP